MKRPIIKKKFKITLLILLISSILCFIISGTLLYNSDYRLSNYSDDFKKQGFDLENLFENNSHNYTIGTSYNINDTKGEVKNIEIITSSVDVEVINSFSNNKNNIISVLLNVITNNNTNTIEDKDINFKYNRDNKTLILDLSDQSLFSTDHRSKLQVTIPEKYKDNLTINRI